MIQNERNEEIDTIDERTHRYYTFIRFRLPMHCIPYRRVRFVTTLEKIR